ncbi:hypothetical protein SB778_31515 [Paraburkholderia sp. SIMBA_050]
MLDYKRTTRTNLAQTRDQPWRERDVKRTTACAGPREGHVRACSTDPPGTRMVTAGAIPSITIDDVSLMCEIRVLTGFYAGAQIALSKTTIPVGANSHGHRDQRPWVPALCSCQSMRSQRQPAASVRHYLIAARGNFPLQLDVIAKIMNTSDRKLKRRLRHEGTTFTELLAECRSAMAGELLSQPPTSH